MASAPENTTGPLVRVIAVIVGLALVMLVIILVTITRSSRSLMNAREAERGEESAAESFSLPPPTLAELARTPSWIWASAEPSDGEAVFFRRTLPFLEPPQRVTLRLTCDNAAKVFIDGEEIVAIDDWHTVVEADLSSYAARGPVTIDVHARNEDGPAGLVAVIDVESADGGKDRIVTDRTWLVADNAEFSASRPATELGVFGGPPWGAIPGVLDESVAREIDACDGFVVESVYEVPRREGSWVSLTVDRQGRLIASGQGQGLFRITPRTPDVDSAETFVESIDLPIGGAQGLLVVDDDLYCMVHGERADGPGLYVVRDTDGDDQYDAYELLRSIKGGGEHGPHGIALGPDGLLYVVAGNHTPVPDLKESVVPRHWDEDHLLPRIWDANGHAVGITAPGGWICATDRRGESWRLFATGFRNPYDLAFSVDGELFTYDADMEWDMGAPWYRPTRVNHVISGADFGWRSGTAKWPPHYPDSLPATLDIGPGSPTGVLFGTGARFPDRYQKALFILDWTFGTIHAVHLEENGATYAGTPEVFVSGRPLPLADAVINPVDGAMYFVVGGRNLPSAVYRVRWTGAVDPPHMPRNAMRPERNTRMILETSHRDANQPDPVETAWTFMGNSDRFVRHAARVALELRPADLWLDRVWQEPPNRARLNGLIAAARCAEPEIQPKMIAALREYDWDDLDREERLSWLRAWALCFIRMGQPPAADRAALADRLDDVYPTDDDMLDRELCDLLVYLRSATVVATTIPRLELSDTSSSPAIDAALIARSDTYGGAILRMAAAPPQRQQVHYALALRNAKRGWTPALRDRYFRWFETAKRTSGGMSFAGFLDQIRAEALENVPEPERARVAAIGTATDPLTADAPTPAGPGRRWTTDAVLALARSGLERGRDFENGRRMFAAASCARCHRFAGDGRAGGPDLTLVSTRYSIRDLAESIVEPSRTISDQYEDTEFVLDDETVIIGRVVDVDETTTRVMPNRMDPDGIVEIARAGIVSERPSRVSPMMPGLLDRLNEDEVLDLLAYLFAEGDARSPMFGQ